MLLRSLTPTKLKKTIGFSSQRLSSKAQKLTNTPLHFLLLKQDFHVAFQIIVNYQLQVDESINIWC